MYVAVIKWIEAHESNCCSSLFFLLEKKKKRLYNCREKSVLNDV